MKSSLKILILDNTREAPSFGSPNLYRLAVGTAPKGSEVFVRRGPDLDLDLHFRPDAILVSGSVTSCLPPYEPWVGELDRFLIGHIEARTPILGVCYGHQSLARCLFRMHGKAAELGRSREPEVGWQTMRIVSESPIFEGLPSRFVSYQSHYEEVSGLPPGTRLTAESDRCRIQAFEMEDAPVFGIQFHPEHGPVYAEETLRAKLARGERKDWILNPGKSHELYNETVGNTIFGNFYRIAQSR